MFQTLSEPIAAVTYGDLPDITELREKKKITEELFSYLEKTGDTDEIAAYISIISPVYSEKDFELIVYSEYGMTRHDNGYNIVRKRVIRTVYSKLTQSFIEKYVSDGVAVTYQSTYAPVICVKAAKPEIIRLAALDEVASVDLFVDYVQEDD